jgi:hypothetical protein
VLSALFIRFTCSQAPVPPCGADGLPYLSVDGSQEEAFLPLAQKSRGDVKPKAMKLLGKQSYCLLDSFKPYQRPKLSDGGHETRRLER